MTTIFYSPSWIFVLLENYPGWFQKQWYDVNSPSGWLSWKRKTSCRNMSRNSFSLYEKLERWVFMKAFISFWKPGHSAQCYGSKMIVRALTLIPSSIRIWYLLSSVCEASIVKVNATGPLNVHKTSLRCLILEGNGSHDWAFRLSCWHGFK